MRYSKLFSHTEVEYITPFIKLWMSFNSWYKSELKQNTDANAIRKCKEEGSIFRNKYTEIYNGRNDISKKFLIALEDFIIAIDEDGNNNNTKKWEELKYSKDIFYIKLGRSGMKNSTLNYISPTTERCYINHAREKELFDETINNIYKIRCQIMHGDFDITDSDYGELVESCYKILHPILSGIFSDAENRIYLCSNNKGTEARGQRTTKKMMTVLQGSKICKQITKSLSNINKDTREYIFKSFAEEKDNYYLLIKDVPFDSPSAAAIFCLGSQVSGPINWKTEDGRTMKSIIDEKEE